MPLILTAFTLPGKSKLGKNAEEEVRVYEEDGTEIDDDECLLAHDAGTVFIIGSNFNIAAVGETDVVKEPDTKKPKMDVRKASGLYHTHLQ
jgi:hypothetical protein